jgi:hypothetical protein
VPCGAYWSSPGAALLVPAGGLVAEPVRGARSLAPNEFVLGIDQERGVMITHQLVEEP